MRRKGFAAALLLVAALLPLGAGSAAAAAPSAEQQLPRAGSRLIVQPAAVGLVGVAALRTARITVRDGCGRTLRTGAVGLEGRGAAVPLPAQGAGPGTWEVSWSTQDGGGQLRDGRWTFEVVEGTPCSSAAAAGAARAGLPGGGGRASGHHGADLAAGAAGGSSLSGAPLVPLIGGVIAMLALATGFVVALRRRGRELAVVVAAHAVVIAFAGGLSPAGVAFAVPAAALVVGSIAAMAVVAVPGLLRRALLAGLVAGAVTGGAAALWAYGGTVILATPLENGLAVVPWQIGATAVAAAVLCTGGWYGTRSSHPA